MTLGLTDGVLASPDYLRLAPSLLCEIRPEHLSVAAAGNKQQISVEIDWPYEYKQENSVEIDWPYEYKQELPFGQAHAWFNQWSA
jgi:hypothetical protein